MTLKQIAGLGRKLTVFLGLFADCFFAGGGRALLRVYVQGQLSDVQRKTAEGIALEFGVAPRTLQRLLESIKWDEEKFPDRCQQIIAKDHGHPEAIGVVDESGVAKSGDDTVGVGRQWNGNRGKVDNCVVGVHLTYAAPGFQCLLGLGASANLEDGLEEISQTNMPGTVENHPNWTRKYASPIDSLISDERLRELGACLRSARPIS